MAAEIQDALLGKANAQSLIDRASELYYAGRLDDAIALLLAKLP